MRGITRAIWLLLPLLVISASLTIASSEEMRAGVVTGLQGTAKVTRASLAQPRDLSFKDDVYLRDQIVTGDASMARILLGGKALLTVRERSIVTITEVPGVSTVSVTSGRAAVNVMKDRMRPGDSVEIVTPNATAAIRGTIVVAEVDPEAAGTRSTITVLRGLIDVSQNDAAGRAVGAPVSVSALQQVMVVGSRLSPVQPITRQTADRLANDFKMGLRAAPNPSMVQPEVDRAVQQIVTTKDSGKDTSKDSGDKTTDSARGDSKSGDGKGGDTKTASAGNASGSGGNNGGSSTAGGGSPAGASTASVNTSGPSAGGGSLAGGSTVGGSTVGGSTGLGVGGGGTGNAGGNDRGNDRVAVGGGGNNGGGALDRIVGGGGGNDRDRDRDRGDKGNKDRGGKKR